MSEPVTPPPTAQPRYRARVLRGGRVVRETTVRGRDKVRARRAADQLREWECCDSYELVGIRSGRVLARWPEGGS